jgi:hypothetical protein
MSCFFLRTNGEKACVYGMSQRQCVEIYLTVNSKSGLGSTRNFGSAKRNVPPISPVPLGKVRSRHRLFTPRPNKLGQLHQLGHFVQRLPFTSLQVDSTRDRYGRRYVRWWTLCFLSWGFSSFSSFPNLSPNIFIWSPQRIRTAHSGRGEREESYR